PHGDPSRVVRTILAEPGYHLGAPSTAVAHQTILELAWTWLVDHVLRPLWHPIVKVLEASQGVGTAIGFLLIALALAAFAFIAFRLVVAFARPARSQASVAPSPGSSLVTARSSIAWREFARQAAARGDYGNAIACLFAAALVALDERAVVVFDAARTPGEYRRSVRRASVEAAPPFDELAERFVRAAYAADEPTASDFHAAERAFAAFEPAMPR
ncbi:MAG: DUF4129 domain-containing protein, partial [Candidatus Eremiobacteraeota bacterium]|nr:DUF4129 domain-containing protein [Candidatus Eremiobacteraeota bacterium]